MRSQRRLSKTITAAKLCQGHPPAKKKSPNMFSSVACSDKDHDIVYRSFVPQQASASLSPESPQSGKPSDRKALSAARRKALRPESPQSGKPSVRKALNTESLQYRTLLYGEPSIRRALSAQGRTESPQDVPGLLNLSTGQPAFLEKSPGQKKCAPLCDRMRKKNIIQF